MLSQENSPSQTINHKSTPEVSPIFKFLGQKRSPRKFNLICFKVIQIIINKNYASYQISVQGNGEIFIMEVRYSTLLHLHQKLSKQFNLEIPFPPKKIIGNLDPQHLTERSYCLEEYLNQLGRDQNIVNCHAFDKFIKKQQSYSKFIVSLIDSEDFNLDQ